MILLDMALPTRSSDHCAARRPTGVKIAFVTLGVVGAICLVGLVALLIEGKTQAAGSLVAASVAPGGVRSRGKAAGSRLVGRGFGGARWAGARVKRRPRAFPPADDARRSCASR